jgi:hypothetical protein
MIAILTLIDESGVGGARAEAAKTQASGSPLVSFRIFVIIEDVKSKSPSTRRIKSKPQGNYIDRFVKQMFSRIAVFMDFLLHYAASKFVEKAVLSMANPIALETLLEHAIQSDTMNECVDVLK